MVIWLNGAFGAGKTQTAYELHRRIENSYVYDPENAGCFIRGNIPESLRIGDFQDYPMWCAFNLEMLQYILERYDGVVIVPMTVTNREYYDGLVGALSERYDVRHFILYCEKETLLRRLASRFEGPGSWAAGQIDRCIRAFDEDILETRLHTDRMSICQTAGKIAELAGIALPEDSRSGLRRALDRIVTRCRHIR